jgi:Heparinase II/III-like protein
MPGAQLPCQERPAYDARVRGRWRTVVAAAACCLALPALGCTTAPGAAETAHAPRAARHALAALSPAARACGSLPGFDKATADEIMAGRLTIAPWPATVVDPHRDGDVNWQFDPFNHPTWYSAFQSGSWIEVLMSGYFAGGPDARAYLARAKALSQSWLRGVPIQDRYPGTLICLSEAFPGQSWIQDQIPPTVDYYAAHWMGAWNHGLQQDLELLKIGCSYPAGAFGGDALRWRQTAVRQMISAFEPNPFGPSIDAQGAVNEQATLYEDFVYNLWTKEGLPELAACGYQLPGWITARIAKMPAFLAEATQPDGNLVQIGDTYVEHPATSPRQPNLVAVYQAGYVFGRSGGDPGASFYSLRFGPGRQVHGHNDHMGLTYYARGRNLIVDAGHTGYENTPYRAYLRSPEASSTLIMPGVPFDAGASTTLLSDNIGRYGQFYEFYDTAFDGNPRYRSVYGSQRPDFVLVFDRASGASSYEQLWHLDPALRVTSLTPSEAIASAPGTELELLQIPLPGQVIPPESTAVIRGQVHPYQGWVSHQMLQRIPADVVMMTRTGPSAAMLTLIVPAAPGTTVTTAISGPPGGPYLLRVQVGASVSVLTVTGDGDITSWAGVSASCCYQTGPGRNRSADHTSSMAICRTGWTPWPASEPARVSRLRSVPSLPALG